jgi:filamentation induced by cAMP protein fic
MTYSPEYLSDLMVRMAHHSTAIEGNTLTQGETKSVLVDGYVPRAMDMRELNEVLNYKVFMTFLIEQSTSSTPLSLSLIREVHTILCREAIESVPGQFKQRPNMIVGADFTPTPPYLVPSALMDWIDNLAAQMDAAASDSDKVLAICRQHIAFEHIHPFPDGNGRVGRALMVYSCFLEEITPIVIPVERRKEYINYLNTEDLHGFAAFSEQLQAEERKRIEIFSS